jgi:hypothetical protein
MKDLTCVLKKFVRRVAVSKNLGSKVTFLIDVYAAQME